MTNRLKSSFVSLGAVLFVALAVLLYAHAVHAQPSSDVIQTSAPATTTVSYLVAGTASSTYQIDNPVFSSGKVTNMQPIDATSMYVQYAASSTSAILTMTPQWSNNNVDWYGFASATASPATNGIIPLASTNLSYQYTPLGTATTSIVLNLPQVNSQHERVIFTVAGANGAVYSEWVLKKNPSTP